MINVLLFIENTTKINLDLSIELTKSLLKLLCHQALKKLNIDNLPL